MKRLFLTLSVVALAVTFNACEGHDPKDLPDHYQHKANHETSHKEDTTHKAGDGKADAHAKGETKEAADPHAKPPVHPNPAPEAKPH
jgi:hypothetical protein